MENIGKKLFKKRVKCQLHQKTCQLRKKWYNEMIMCYNKIAYRNLQ